MKTLFRFAAFGLLPLASGAFGQAVRVNTHTLGYGTDVFYASAYDQHTVVRFKAKVKGLSKTPGKKPGEATDAALLVLPFTMGKDAHGKSIFVYAKDYVPVELGPEWFVDDQITKIKLNDYVEITGSQMTMGGMRFIMAQMIRDGHDVLAMRRMSGEPYWYAFRPQPTPAEIADADMKAQEDAAANWASQSEGQHVWTFGSVQVYGGVWPISGSRLYNVSGYAPLKSFVNPVIIQGYWYDGPPTVIRN